MAVGPDSRLHSSIRPGDKPSVVLLHSLGLDKTVWQEIWPDAAPGHRLVAFDLPGHGKSPAPTVPTIEGFADDVADSMRALGMGETVLVGMSLGGSVAQAVAIRHPDLVAALVLVDTTAWYGPDASTAWTERARRAMSEGFDAMSEFQLTRWVSDTYRLRNPDRCQALLEIFRSNDLAAYSAACQALGAMDLRNRLPDIRAAAEILVGEWDAATPVSQARILKEAIPAATLTVIPGVRHLSAVERPDAVTAAVSRALSALETV